MFPVSLTFGRGKPYNLQWLTNGIANLKDLLSNGILRSSISLKTVVADLPAKAYIKKTLQYNSLDGCDRCKKKGVHANNKTTFAPPAPGEIFSLKPERTRCTGVMAIIITQG